MTKCLKTGVTEPVGAITVSVWGMPIAPDTDYGIRIDDSAPAEAVPDGSPTSRYVGPVRDANAPVTRRARLIVTPDHPPYVHAVEAAEGSGTDEFADAVLTLAAVLDALARSEPDDQLGVARAANDVA